MGHSSPCSRRTELASQALGRYRDTLLHSIFPPENEPRTAPPRNAEEFEQLLGWSNGFEGHLWTLAQAAVNLTHEEEAQQLEMRRAEETRVRRTRELIEIGENWRRAPRPIRPGPPPNLGVTVPERALKRQRIQPDGESGGIFVVGRTTEPWGATAYPTTTSLPGAGGNCPWGELGGELLGDAASAASASAGQYTGARLRDEGAFNASLAAEPWDETNAAG